MHDENLGLHETLFVHLTSSCICQILNKVGLEINQEYSVGFVLYIMRRNVCLKVVFQFAWW
jgi:hypothetical protein